MSVSAHTEVRSGLRRVVALTAATIGVISGYNLGNTSGALLFVPPRVRPVHLAGESVTTVVVAGSVVGALMASKRANAISGKLTMILLSIGYVVFALLSAAAAELVFLDVARFLLGVTIGLAVVSWIFIYQFATETKGRKLEAVQEYWENGGVWPAAEREPRPA
jgi:MFS family permease